MSCNKLHLILGQKHFISSDKQFPTWGSSSDYFGARTAIYLYFLIGKTAIFQSKIVLT